jgi:2'-5' RNA ligase
MGGGGWDGSDLVSRKGPAAMPSVTRTFIAIVVPEDRAELLGALQGRIGPEVPGARWVDPHQFHATLTFLGDVPDANLEMVRQAVARGSEGFAPLELSLEGLGVFPRPSRPSTIWVGLAGPGVEVLIKLQKAIVKALTLTRVVPCPEGDRFTPHVTLGRLKAGRGPGPNLTALVERYRSWSAGRFVASEVITFGSRLTPNGPVYTPLGRAPLGGGKGPAPP